METQKAPRSPALSELDLVAAVLAGDMCAMQTLMRQHNRTLYRTARAILRDDDEAEDAVQEAYLQAYRSLGSFRGESKLSTWLVRITANTALMRRRRRLREASIVSIDGMPEAAASWGQSMSDRPGPERDAMAAEVRKILESRIDRLPDVYREVFMLRAVEELSVEETAAALSVPEATVRTRYFRARGLLRESLEKDMDVALSEAFSFAGSRCDRIVESVLAAIAADRSRQSP